MILVVEDRPGFHLLAGVEAAPRSTELALQRMGWRDLPPPSPAPAAKARPPEAAPEPAPH